MLLSPGRIGTSSPELGVPLKFSGISRFSAIAEYDDAESGFLPELSFGSHMFQDLVESGILYAALFSVGPEPARLDLALLHKKAKKLSDVELPERVRAAVNVYDTSGKLTLYHDMVGGETVCVFENT
jgi:hypothetical protein